MGGEVSERKDLNILLNLKKRKNQCPGGTVFYKKRIYECFRPQRRMVRMEKGWVSSGKKIGGHLVRLAS